mgnify:FL=1
MAGAKNRPVSLGGESRYFNVLFLVKDLKRLEKIADIDGVTKAHLVRHAVSVLLDHWIDERKLKKK